MLTPLDIENKRFSKTIKGYNVDEVDDWGDSSFYTVLHYFCKKCGKYKKIKSH